MCVIIVKGSTKIKILTDIFFFENVMSYEYFMNKMIQFSLCTACLASELSLNSKTNFQLPGDFKQLMILLSDYNYNCNFDK